MNALGKKHKIRRTWKELWDRVQEMTPAQSAPVSHMMSSYNYVIFVFFFYVFRFSLKTNPSLLMVRLYTNVPQWPF